MAMYESKNLGLLNQTSPPQTPTGRVGGIHFPAEYTPSPGTQPGTCPKIESYFKLRSGYRGNKQSYLQGLRQCFSAAHKTFLKLSPLLQMVMWEAHIFCNRHAYIDCTPRPFQCPKHKKECQSCWPQANPRILFLSEEFDSGRKLTSFMILASFSFAISASLRYLQSHATLSGHKDGKISIRSFAAL